MDLSIEDKRHLEAAEGWLGLGDLKESTAELEKITIAARDHPDILRVRWGICAKSQDWELAAQIGKTLTERQPGKVWGYVHLAYALHEMKRTSEAKTILLPTADKFPKNWLVFYNLSCYCCQLGEFREAIRWLSVAIQLADKMDIQLMALEDKDLEPLWQQIKQI